MKEKFTFRPLDVSDVSFLAQYAAECDGISDYSEIKKIERRLTQRLKNQNYIGVIAMLNKKQIGFVDGIIVNQTLELNEIYVNKKYRRKGIGEKLLKEIILMAKTKGINRAFFQTEPDNIPMQKLGEKFGFKLKVLTYEKILE